TIVADVSTALDMLRERKDGDDQFDLVISDFFIPNNGINGLKFLELVAVEMDIPVIVLSANDEMETMAKAIQHGACHYMVKPVRPEMVKNIWLHVVRKSKSNIRNKVNNRNDNPSQIGQPVDDEKDDAKHTRKHCKKNRKDGDGSEKDEVISTQKKQRVEWTRQLHSKFLEAINHIGMDNAVPKKILEVMNVDGITKENVASHLQKFRMYLKKQKEGTLKYSAFVDEQQAWLNGKTHVNSNMSVPECSSTQISNEHPPLGTSMSFPSSCSGISYASKLRASILGSNKGIPFDPDSFFEEMAGVAPSSHLPLQSPELVNLPSTQIWSSSIGMLNQVAREPPQFTSRNSNNYWTTGVSSSFHDGQNVGMSIGPSQRNNIFMNQLPGLVASSQSVPCSRNEYHQNQMAGVMGTTPMVSFNEQATLAPFNFGSNGSSTVMPINNFVPGSSLSTRPSLSNLKICNSLILTQMPNGGGTTGNLPEGGTVGHQTVGDQENNKIQLPITNELPTAGTSEAQNGAIDNIDAFFADWVKQDLLNDDDAFFNGM
ncbi:hypothetical protein SORBI_3010G208100, partial [Sorghum bicolor]